MSHILGVTTMRVRYLTMLLGLTLCGCAAIQDYKYNFVQRFRADVAYKGNYGVWSGNSRHYHDGWKQGYFDLSTGQCDEAPATPPHKYWDACYQSLDGRAAIDQWYSGWQDGATAAIQDGRPYFNPVVASPTAPVNTYGSQAFHSGGGVEALPPAAATHDAQPQVHVGPAPHSFTSQPSAMDEEIDDRGTPDAVRAFDPPAVDLGGASGNLNDYYSGDAEDEAVGSGQ